MVKGIKILEKLGKENFCKWLRKNGHKLCINLENANLYEANLQWADLRESDLHEADLRESDLSGSNLRGANLRGANLSGSNLRGANLRGANLSEADLRGANIDFSCLPLWCGSVGIIIDDSQAKQVMAHAMHLARKYWPGDITEEQKAWLNDFHQIKADAFPKFE